MHLSDINRQRFESKFEIEPMSGCWLWTAGASSPYPQFAIKRRAHGAHRVSWMLYRGEIPKDMHVCHHCDNPYCVNPSHLFLGTAKDNQQDCLRKGRSAFQKGTHPRIKIKEQEKLDICMLGWCDWPQTKIAQALGIKLRATVAKLLRAHGIPIRHPGDRRCTDTDSTTPTNSSA